MSVLKLRGFEIHKGLLGSAEQLTLLEAVRDIAKAAPVFSPMTPYGKPMSVKMTSAGKEVIQIIHQPSSTVICSFASTLCTDINHHDTTIKLK